MIRLTKKQLAIYVSLFLVVLGFAVSAYLSTRHDYDKLRDNACQFMLAYQSTHNEVQSSLSSGQYLFRVGCRMP